jgi:tartrate dehydratase alpha subunit/fumarate hydratase class I-like protein
MTKQEILERIEDILNQGVDTEYQDLDLLRHELENNILDEDNKKDVD